LTVGSAILSVSSTEKLNTAHTALPLAQYGGKSKLNLKTMAIPLPCTSKALHREIRIALPIKTIAAILYPNMNAEHIFIAEA
jgi:hypothetical protein